MNDRIDIKRVVMLTILDKRGVFSYKRAKIKKLNIKNIMLVKTGIKIAGFAPSLASPQGI